MWNLAINICFINCFSAQCAPAGFLGVGEREKSVLWEREERLGQERDKRRGEREG